MGPFFLTNLHEWHRLFLRCFACHRMCCLPKASYGMLYLSIRIAEKLNTGLSDGWTNDHHPHEVKWWISKAELMELHIL